MTDNKSAQTMCLKDHPGPRSSQAIATCIEALLPKMWLNIACWWEVKNVCFLLLLLCGLCFLFVCLFSFPLIKLLPISQAMSFLFFFSIFSTSPSEKGEWENSMVGPSCPWVVKSPDAFRVKSPHSYTNTLPTKTQTRSWFTEVPQGNSKQNSVQLI